MRKTLAVLLMGVACGGLASGQNLEVNLTQSKPGGMLRAGALYIATPIGEWLYLDLAIEPFVNGNLRPDRDIYLVGPDGTRISLPDLRTIRANRERILGMFGLISTSGAAGAFPIGKQFKIHCGTILPGNSGEDAGMPSGCPRYALWRFDAGRPVERVIPLRNSGLVAQMELLFRASTGTWTAGDYVLTIEGPGDSVTELPVPIG